MTRTGRVAALALAGITSLTVPAGAGPAEFEAVLVTSGELDRAQAACTVEHLRASLAPARFAAITGFGLVRPPSGGPQGGLEEVEAIGRAVHDCAGGG